MQFASVAAPTRERSLAWSLAARGWLIRGGETELHTLLESDVNRTETPQQTVLKHFNQARGSECLL